MAITWQTDNGWRWCKECQGLFFGANAAASNCPAGGTHVVGSSRYSLVRNAATTPPNHQSGWRRCGKCQTLFLALNIGSSNCPESGQHSTTGSPSYLLSRNAGAGQTQWRRCTKCEGLYFSGPVHRSVAPKACQSIVTAINSLLAEKQDLADQLDEASPSQKPSIVNQIKQVESQITTKEAELAQCVNQNRKCPSGGTHQAGADDYHIPIVGARINIHVKILTQPNIALATLFHNAREVFAPGLIDIQWVSEEFLSLPALNILDVGSCSGSTTDEQDQLFANRNSAGANDLVIYFIDSTVPAANGCASHPSGQPGAVVVKTASPWTFAHEQGHVLDLDHVDNNDRLMTGNGTGNITSPPPDLLNSEYTTMHNSPFTVSI